MASDNYEEDPQYYWAIPGMINFLSRLEEDTINIEDEFRNFFAEFGEIKNLVFWGDMNGRSTGSGVVTYADPSVVDSVLAETLTIHGKQVEMRRVQKRRPKFKDFKTKIISLNGVPSSLTDDEIKNFFSQFGEVVDQDIANDGYSRFGLIVFDNEQVVDNILKNGNVIDMAGTQVVIERA